MSHALRASLPDEAATQAFAAELARVLGGAGGVIYLQGELGAGKTSLVRGFLQALGYAGRVVSPTYTLIEPYELSGGQRAFHLDLYRVADPEELLLLGLRDIDTSNDLMLVEWPELGQGYLPEADIRLLIQDAESGNGRKIHLEAGTSRGQHQLGQLDEAQANI
ncbi:MAG: tRNA (adenosine(37)-N6)-threonylcarbamoyltransferase complex ATPase subunit type 1 TsaE [Salinisphaeraceae bacterium]|nr:tRNA (adenosine(37)-N6)-threonylcarbamoyltransferase complex ATPase subunit type 1 TsaE [Salinisphaeraceae bacterium]